MKKLILVLTILVFTETIFAAGIRFVENKKWVEILALAKKENKLIFLDGYATWCGPCKYMQEDVFTSDAAGSYFNSRFINVKLDMEEGEGLQLSEQFNLRAYPTLFFVNGDGQLVHKYVGALNVEDFVKLGEEAINPDKQFFTLKKKAEAGQMTPGAFHDWVHSAESLKEESVDSSIVKYLSATKHPMMEKEMLTLIHDHAAQVPEKLLRFLYDNKAKVAELTGKTVEEVDENLMQKLRYHALETSAGDMAIDFVLYRKVIAKFVPQMATSELQRVKVKYFFYKEETEQALQELAIYLEKPEFGLTARGLADIITGYADKIVAEDQAETFIKKIEAYNLLPGEREQGYYKDIAMLWIYYNAENEEKTNQLMVKIMENSQVPKKLKEVVSRIQEKNE